MNIETMKQRGRTLCKPENKLPSGTLTALACSFLSCFLSVNAWAEASVWQVTKDEQKLYLGGTVHLLRPGDYPLPEEYDRAYKDSEELVFEIDISLVNDLAFQTKLLQEMTYSDGSTLKTVLNDEAYEALSQFASTSGMPMMMMESFKPGMVVTMLQALEIQKLGFTPEGVDMHFNNRAVSDGKPIAALESLEQQIGFLSAMGVGYESEFVLQSLKELESTEEMMSEMVDAWRSGDSSELNDLFVAEMQASSPEMYQSLLVDRNNAWIPQLEQMMLDQDTEFVLVGAAHLIGDHGVVKQLRDRGYQVEKL